METGDLDRELIVCRCEEVKLGALWEAMDQGDRCVDAIKLRTRAGMGICQGRTCLRVVQSLLRTHHPDASLDLHKQRWPVRPVPLDPLSRPLLPPPDLQIPLMELDLASLEEEG
jgi:hypothetical protein